MHIVDGTDNFKMIITRLFVNKIDRFCKMKPICDHDPGMIILDFDHDRIMIWQRVYFFVVYNYSYIQNTEEYLFLPANDDII